MNRIQRIQNFINDYKTLDPYLKSLLIESKKDYELKLVEEYIRFGLHPYPNEYLDNT